MTERALRIGWIAFVYAIWIVLAPWLSLGAASGLLVYQTEPWALRAVPAAIGAIAVITIARGP